MAFNTQIEQMNTQTPAHANEFNKRFNQLSDNDKYLNENKVDKVSGKGLSDENYSTAEKQKLVNVEAGANKYAHPSSHPASMVTGLHALATSGDYNDLKNKPDLSNKVDKISGKGLSTEDFTTELRRKLGDIGYSANNYTHPNTHPARMITCDDGKSVESHLDDLKTDETRLTKAKDITGAINELFTNANNGKTLISNVVGNPLLASDTFQQQTNKIQGLKNTLASNLTAKEQISSGTESLQNLVNRVGNINTSCIKSIQRGTSAVSGNIFINPVDINSSIILTSSPRPDKGEVVFKANNNIAISHGVWGDIDSISKFSWQVIEFNNVKSKQTGSVSFRDISDNKKKININNVNISKTIVLAYSEDSDNTDIRKHSDVYCFLENSNTLSFQGMTKTNFEVTWQVIEFN